MTSSLVGSEMCIRDRPKRYSQVFKLAVLEYWLNTEMLKATFNDADRQSIRCLLYTSDAADDM
eukprot:3294410-Prorocentrum_lima.AAC.1